MNEDEAHRNKSFYALTISCNYDGGRESFDLYCYASMAHIRSCVLQQIQPTSAELIGYTLLQFAPSPEGGGGEARLWVVENGSFGIAVDLLPFATVKTAEGSAPLRSVRTMDESERLAANGALVHIDWEAFLRAVPPLRGSLLAAGETVLVHAVPSEILDQAWALPFDEDDQLLELRYGFNDAVDPETSSNLPFVDPDPPL